MVYVVGKIHGKSWNQGIQYTTNKGDKKSPADNVNKTKENWVSDLKFLNKTAYNELILAQKDTVCFKIIEEARAKDNKYGYTIQAWIKRSIKFDPTTGASKTIIHKKLSNCKIYDLTINPE